MTVNAQSGPGEIHSEPTYAPAPSAAAHSTHAHGDAPELRVVNGGRASPTSMRGHAPFRPCVVIPAYEAARSLEAVIEEVHGALPEIPRSAIIVVDDGSRDDTAAIALRGGAHVVSHGRNRGKGAALATGLGTARTLGFDVALAVDADGQHPGEAARAVLYASTDARTMVLGTRNLARDGAPRKNRFSNGVSNFFLTRFSAGWSGGRTLTDTQCGLRRYPVRETLALGAFADGYAFEAEVLLRALKAQLPVLEVPVSVRYPSDRVTHFDNVKDPTRIVVVVLRTMRELTRGPQG